MAVTLWFHFSLRTSFDTETDSITTTNVADRFVSTSNFPYKIKISRVFSLFFSAFLMTSWGSFKESFFFFSPFLKRKRTRGKRRRGKWTGWGRIRDTCWGRSRNRNRGRGREPASVNASAWWELRMERADSRWDGARVLKRMRTHRPFRSYFVQILLKILLHKKHDFFIFTGYHITIKEITNCL